MALVGILAGSFFHKPLLNYSVKFQSFSSYVSDQENVTTLADAMRTRLVAKQPQR